MWLLALCCVLLGASHLRTELRRRRLLRRLAESEYELAGARWRAEQLAKVKEVG